MAVYSRARRGEFATAVGTALLATAIMAVVAGAAVDASGFSFLDIEGHEFMSLLGSATGLSSALVLGGVGAIAVVGGAKRLGNRVPGRRVLILSAVPLVTVASSFLLLVIVEEQTSKFEVGRHPANVSTGPLSAAVLVAEELNLPTGIAVTSEGVVFWAENLGMSLQVANPLAGGGYQVSEFASTADFGAEEPYHLVLHPEWPEQPYIYVSAAHPGDGDTFDLGLFRIRSDGLHGVEGVRIAGGFPYQPPRHMGTGLAFCGGYLYFSVGDVDLPGVEDGTRNLAQDPRAPHGKILRYKLNGIELEPAGILAQDPPVFAMGFRNVFGMDCAEDTQTLVVADNGPIGHDQVRFVAPGSNHEWPFSSTRDTLASPLYTSGPTPIGVSGLAWRSPTEILLATVNPQSVYRLTLDESSNLERTSTFFEVEGPAIAVTIGADSCTYVADTSRIWRIVDDVCP